MRGGEANEIQAQNSAETRTPSVWKNEPEAPFVLASRSQGHTCRISNVICKRPFRQGSEVYPCRKCIACLVNRKKDWTTRMICEATQHPEGSSFVTLTYADADAWQARHVSGAVEAFRQWCRRRRVPCRYTWVAEIQPKRAARTGQAVVHYHLLAWLPVGVPMPMWDRPTADGRPAFWPHGMTERDLARSGVGYLMKYLSKLGEFHRFPKGLRLYGIGGLDAGARSVRGWFNLPQWCKNSFGVGEVFRAAGRLVVRATGEVLVSPWRVRLVPGGLVLRLVGEIPPRLHDGAYSSVKGCA